MLKCKKYVYKFTLKALVLNTVVENHTLHIQETECTIITCYDKSLTNH